jgi:hypothetical protein
MKQVTSAACFFCLLFLFLISSGCRHHHSINITIVESEEIYRVKAQFDERKTTVVDRYLNRQLGTRNNMSFINTRIDGDLMLDDRTTFYIRKRPGTLEIKFDKQKNSMNSYYEIKAMGDGLKSLLQRD